MTTHIGLYAGPLDRWIPNPARVAPSIERNLHHSVIRSIGANLPPELNEKDSGIWVGGCRGPGFLHVWWKQRTAG